MADPVVVLDTNDEQYFSTRLPALLFTGTDADADDITYEIQIDTVSSFDSQGSTPFFTAVSDTDDGFANEDTPADTEPFTSGEQMSFTVGKVLEPLDSDNFNRANSSNPGSEWDVYNGTCNIVSNQLKPSGSTNKCYFNATVPDNDQWVQTTLYGTYWCGIYLRSWDNSGTLTAYCAGVNLNDGSFRFWKVISNGSWGTYIDAGTTSTGIGAGDTMRFEVEGQDSNIILRAYENGSLIKTLTTPSVEYNSGGASCFVLNANTAIHDNFIVGNLYLTEKTYYWRVRGSDDGGSTWGSYSAAKSFTITTGDVYNFSSTVANTSSLSSIGLILSRLLVSAPGIVSSLSSTALNSLCSLLSSIGNASSLANVGLDITIDYNSTVALVSLLNSITLDVTGLVEFLSTISCETSLASIDINMLRKLATTIANTGSLSSITVPVLNNLLSSVSTQSSLSNISVYNLLSLLTTAAVQANLSSISLTNLLSILSTVGITLSLGDIVLLAAVITGIGTSNVINKSDIMQSKYILHNASEVKDASYNEKTINKSNIYTTLQID